MLYIVAVILGLAIGLILKGTPANVLNMDFRCKWTFIAALVIQASAQVLGVKGMIQVQEYSLVIQAVVFMLLLAGFWLNRNYLGHLVTGAGCALNAAVMLANDGKMPVDGHIITEVIKDVELRKLLLSDGKHSLADNFTNFHILSDIFHIPGFFGLGMRIVSIGDLVVVAGIFTLVLELTLNKRFGKVSRTKRIDFLNR